MAKKEPIRIGLIGLGRAGWGMHVEELKGKEHLFRIVAVCDPVTERLKMAADQFGCRTYTEVKDLIADPDVELVDITSRSTDHAPHALAALKAGKLVFLEKPMCMSHAEALQLKRAARGRLFIRHNRRFEPAFQHIREIIASGVIGEVFEIKLRRHSYLRRDDWQTLIACGGGQLLNWGPHIIDHALRLLGAPVKEQWTDLKRLAAVGDAEDHVNITLRGKNARVVNLEISGGAAIQEPEFIVFGAKGALTCTGETIQLRYLDPKQKLRTRKANAGVPVLGGFGTQEELKWIEKTLKAAPKTSCNITDTIWFALYDTVRRRKPFPIKLDEAVEVMRIADAARRGTPFVMR
jgi:predicted dehydrogenase